jgi:predicted HicB family RNase H-like nuclease
MPMNGVKKRKAGRPKLRIYDKQLSVDVTRAMHQKVRDVARARDQQMAEFVRAALRKAVDECAD